MGAIAAKTFGVIHLTGENKRDSQINRAQFYQALSDLMTARMLLTADTSITDDLSVLLPQPWSVNTTAEYGWGGIPLDCSAFFGTIFWSTEGRLS